MVGREHKRTFVFLLVLLASCIAVASFLGCEKQMPVAPSLTLEELDAEEGDTDSPQICGTDPRGNQTITTRAFITSRRGGKLRIPKATFLHVPPYAVNHDMWISATIRVRQVFGRVDTLEYEFAPNNLTFNVPASLVLRYGHLDIEDGEGIVLYMFNEKSEEWELMDEQTISVDRKRKRIVFLIDEFTRYFVARR